MGRLGVKQVVLIAGKSRPRTDKSTCTMSRKVLRAVLARGKLWAKVLAKFIRVFDPTHFTLKITHFTPVDPS